MSAATPEGDAPACASCRGLVAPLALDDALAAEARRSLGMLLARPPVVHQLAGPPPQAVAARAAGDALRDALAGARAAEVQLRREEAALRSRLAGALADITELRLEVSRLRGCATATRDAGPEASTAPPTRRRAGACSSPRGSAGGGDSHVAARVQAAVQAQLRALRWQDSQRAACPVCMREDRPKDTALGCGHVFCGECSAALRTCALCRADITLRVHLY